MGNYSASQVIQSLADVTRHADRELLDISLASTLYELLKADQIVHYKIIHSGELIECYRCIEVLDGKAKMMEVGMDSTRVDYLTIPGFEECINSGKSITDVSDMNKSIVFYPVADNHNNIIGIFQIERPANIPTISNKFISGYFQVYQNYLNLLNDSERDTLTGLLNRRTFERDLKKICAKQIDHVNDVDEHHEKRCQQQGVSHWLAITDIDFFKQVNDNFGHLYGDEVLLLLANIMRETFRGADVLFRFGGEEFVIILRSTNLEGANTALERFRTKVEAFDFPKVGKVTISIGFIEISEHSIPTEILGNADEALYFSKDNGRNQVNQYEQLVLDEKVAKTGAAIDDIELF